MPTASPVALDEGWRTPVRAHYVSWIVGSMVVAVLISRLLRPHYFAASELIFGYSGGISPFALLIRILIPFSIGVTAVRFSSATLNEVTIGGATASLLFVWPTILIPDIALGSELYEQRHLLYIVYLLFSIAFTYSARVGAHAGNALRERVQVLRGMSFRRIKMHKTMRDIALALLASALYSVLQFLWGAAY